MIKENSLAYFKKQLDIEDFSDFFKNRLQTFKETAKAKNAEKKASKQKKEDYEVILKKFKFNFISEKIVNADIKDEDASWELLRLTMMNCGLDTERYFDPDLATFNVKQSTIRRLINFFSQRADYFRNLAKKLRNKDNNFYYFISFLQIPEYDGMSFEKIILWSVIRKTTYGKKIFHKISSTDLVIVAACFNVLPSKQRLKYINSVDPSKDEEVEDSFKTLFDRFKKAIELARANAEKNLILKK